MSANMDRCPEGVTGCWVPRYPVPRRGFAWSSRFRRSASSVYRVSCGAFRALSTWDAAVVGFRSEGHWLRRRVKSRKFEFATAGLRCFGELWGREL